jgi:hypothetical protein
MLLKNKDWQEKAELVLVLKKEYYLKPTNIKQGDFMNNIVNKSEKMYKGDWTNF